MVDEGVVDGEVVGVKNVRTGIDVGGSEGFDGRGCGLNR